MTGRQTGVLGAAMGLPRISNAFLRGILEGSRFHYQGGELAAVPVGVRQEELQRTDEFNRRRACLRARTCQFDFGLRPDAFRLGVASTTGHRQDDSRCFHLVAAKPR